jgi:hypothetical protein
MDTLPAFVRCLVTAAVAFASRAGRVASAAVLVAAGLASAGARADEDPSGRVARVAEVSGEVRTVDPEGAWVALPRNQPLSTGDRVITDKDGRATIQVGSSTVRLGAYSDMSITRLDDQKIFLHFDHGQMAVRVRSTDILGELTIETDEGTWVPHHPGYFRFDRAPGGVLGAQAWSGDMLLEAPDSSLPVAANQRAEVWREGAQQTTHYRMVQAPVDKFSDWALVQDKLDDRYAAENAEKDAAAAGAVPPEMTGGADLGRYGQWSNSPDYGEVWTPDALPSGWQPYQDGSWSWMSPWGWTWIDNSAWGFAPFHYGRWVSVRGRWCWSPGRWAGRPVYAPALVGWLGGAGFAVGGTPAVGWVALGPGEAFYPGYAVSPRYWSVVNGGRVPPGGGVEVGRGRSRFVPTGPTAYMNLKVPGAVTVVAQSSLVPHAPIAAMPGMRAANRRQAFADASARSTEQPPPAPPAGHSALAPSAGVVQVPGGGRAVPAAAGVAAPLAGVQPATAAGKGAAPAVRRPATSPVAPSPTITPPAPVAPQPVPPLPTAPAMTVHAPVMPAAPVAPVAPVAPTVPAMRSTRSGAGANPGQGGDDRAGPERR